MVMLFQRGVTINWRSGWLSHRDLYRYQQLEAALDDAPERGEEAANA